MWSVGSQTENQYPSPLRDLSMYILLVFFYVNVREYRRRNLKWTIQRNRQQGTQDEDKQNNNTTQYMLETTLCKQSQIT